MVLVVPESLLPTGWQGCLCTFMEYEFDIFLQEAGSEIARRGSFLPRAY